jgi:tRNA (uracil-5-)-methyltransferase
MTEAKNSSTVPVTNDTDNCNNRIAPWFGRLDVDVQRFGKSSDFKRIIRSIEYEVNNSHAPKLDGSIKHHTSPTGQHHLSNGESQSIETKTSPHSCTSIIDLNNTVSGILFGPNDTGYRNKNKFTFGYDIECFDFPPGSDIDNDHVKLGFIGGEYPKIFIADCDVACTIDDKFKTLCKGVEKIVKSTTIKPFLQPPRKHKKLKKQKIDHIPVHRGVWRYLTIRRAKSLRKILENEYVYMVTLTTFTRNVNDTNRDEYKRVIENMKEYLQSKDYVSSFNLVEYSTNLEPSASDKAVVLFSKETCDSTEEPGVIYETLMGKIFRISPMSFFQVNTEVTELLYSEIGYMFDHLFTISNDSSDEGHKKILIDLYCGTGTIGICLANRFDHIIGVDIVESCINDAKINAKLNNVKNCTFLTGRCEDKNILDNLQSALDQISNGGKIKIYLVVDPARDGLHRKIRRFIKELKLDGFVYCSCNVKTWTTDVIDMIKIANPCTDDDLKKHKKNQTVISLHPIKTMIFDMFPHTQHYEVLSSFKCLSKST